MSVYQLQITLRSDTTIGRGDGLAGLVDQEVEHDSATGLPYLRGRTLKGLLSEACDAFVAVDSSGIDWNPSLQRLFGRAGSRTDSAADWHFGDAQLPDDLRAALARDIAAQHITAAKVLELVTTIRRQTSEDVERGTPQEHSLRSARVICRELVLTSRLHGPSPDKALDLQLLAIGALALRQLGAGRNRGRGRIDCRLFDAHGRDVTAAHFIGYAEAIA